MIQDGVRGLLTAPHSGGLSAGRRSRNQSSAELHSAVTRICNPPRSRTSNALPSATRRLAHSRPLARSGGLLSRVRGQIPFAVPQTAQVSRLQICATKAARRWRHARRGAPYLAVYGKLRPPKFGRAWGMNPGRHVGQAFQPAGSRGIPAAQVFCGQGCPQNRQPGWLPYDCPVPTGEGADRCSRGGCAPHFPATFTVLRRVPKVTQDVPRWDRGSSGFRA